MKKTLLTILCLVFVVGCTTDKSLKEKEIREKEMKEYMERERNRPKSTPPVSSAPAPVLETITITSGTGPLHPSSVFAAPPPPVPASASSPYPYSLKPPVNGIGSIVLTRETILSEKELPDGPVSFILLPKRPTTKELKVKYVFICQEWVANFFTKKESTYSLSSVTQVPFLWLLDDKENNPDCSELVEKYDYARSYSLALSLKLDVTKIFIVLKHTPNMVTMNLTPLNKEEDLSLAMSIWKQRMIILPTSKKEVNINNIFYSTKTVLGTLSTLLTLK